MIECKKLSHISRVAPDWDLCLEGRSTDWATAPRQMKELNSNLSLQKFVEICLHEALDDVDVLHLIDWQRPQDVADVDDVLVGKPD